MRNFISQKILECFRSSHLRTLNTIWPMPLAKVLMAKVMLLMMTFLLAVLLILVSLNSSASPK